MTEDGTTSDPESDPGRPALPDLDRPAVPDPGRPAVPDPGRSAGPEPMPYQQGADRAETTWVPPAGAHDAPDEQYPAPPVMATWPVERHETPPGPARRGTGLKVGLAVGAAALLLGSMVAVVALAGSDGRTADHGSGGSGAASSSPAPPPSVNVITPDSVAGYKQLTGSRAQSAITEMREELRPPGSVADWRDKARLALYEKGPAQLVFMGYAALDDPDLARYLAHSPATEINQMFGSSEATDVKDYPAGSPGGVLRCGKTLLDGIPMSLCGWADRSAMITLIGSEITPEELSSLTLKVRRAAVLTVG